MYPLAYLISIIAYLIHGLISNMLMFTWLLCFIVNCGCMSLAIAFTSMLYFLIVYMMSDMLCACLLAPMPYCGLRIV